MKNKIFDVAIIGLGGRGGYAYGLYINELKDKYRISAICDINPVRTEKWGEIFNVPNENRFVDEDEFFKQKRGDVLLICTLDQLHVRMANKALELGYDILLEKPISADPEELKSLVEHANKAKRTVMVCHVLRYTAWINKAKEIIDSGAIGELISIDHTENVVYWHQAHSFVRGNWHNSKETAPMILAKACHDLDLIQFFAESRAKCVSSMGDLRYFVAKNKPKGSSDRCTNCKFIDSCTYSAKRIYVDNFKAWGSAQVFPFTLITDVYPVTEEALWDAIKTNDYGKCVFACNNDVVDNQTVIITFENKVTATLKMEAFTQEGGRDIRFFGSLGELSILEAQNQIVLKVFGGETTVWKISEIAEDYYTGGHGGGDNRMIDELYNVLNKDAKGVNTSIEASVESHYMALAAEESRLNEGQLVYLNKFRK